MKKLFGFLLLLAALVAAALFWLRGNLDGLLKDAIATYGSAMTQAKVSVGAVEVRAADGAGIIRNLSIGNPTGFRTAHAFQVGEVEVAIDMASVTRDVVLVRRIAIKAPDVIYEKGESMTNFDAIQKNITAYLGSAAGKKDGEGGKKLIVQELTVRDAKAQVTAAFMQGNTVSVPLPDITLRDLGKDKGGLPPGELGAEITRALKQKLSAAVSFDNLTKSTGQALDKADETIKGLFGK